MLLVLDDRMGRYRGATHIIFVVRHSCGSWVGSEKCGEGRRGEGGSCGVWASERSADDSESSCSYKAGDRSKKTWGLSGCVVGVAEDKAARGLVMFPTYAQVDVRWRSRATTSLRR